jgi:hypothetical protein
MVAQLLGIRAAFEVHVMLVCEIIYNVQSELGILGGKRVILTVETIDVLHLPALVVLFYIS